MDQDDFGYYHPELEEKDNFRNPKSTDYKITSKGFAHDCSVIWGWSGSDDDFDIFGDVPPPVPKELKCECGSDAIKAKRHSDWCPKYKKVDDG